MHVSALSPTRLKHILVVDDSKSFRLFISGLLTEKGYRVTQADSGRAAYNLLKNLRFDLVISDVIMEDVNGLELRDKMLADETLALIPFIVMTSDRRHDGPQNFEGRGIAGYLIKPFLPGQLLIMVKRLLASYDEIMQQNLERVALERNLLFGAISSLARALNARDGYTKSHSDAVGKLAVRISRRMGLPGQDVEYIHLAGQLHDLGKIGVPDSILQKPDKLTTEEYEVIKTHSVVGADIIAPIPGMGQVAKAIRHHHESYDGTGYPDGLKGEGIPLWARIIAVADIFDALTSDRPYRKGFPMDKAYKMIVNFTGTQLCPLCVDAFMDTAPPESGAKTPFVVQDAMHK